jgi:F-type H+-transporting ATPase subunit delta
MQVNKDIRQTARELLRASFTDGQLDEGRIMSVVDSLLQRRPRNYIKILAYYRRLLRLEVEKRHARIETSAPLDETTASEITSNLVRKYGDGLTAEFVVKPGLLGGMRIRVGSDVWDSTVRNRLEQLEQQLERS